jgi:hypothetical protein
MFEVLDRLLQKEKLVEVDLWEPGALLDQLRTRPSNKPSGNLTEGLKVFELKDGNVI